MDQVTNIGVELTDLRDHGQCKYPVHTDGKHHTFCGKPSASSWCPDHEKMVWVPLEERRRRRR